MVLGARLPDIVGGAIPGDIGKPPGGTDIGPVWEGEGADFGLAIPGGGYGADLFGAALLGGGALLYGLGTLGGRRPSLCAKYQSSF